jgi:hypothetical protein
LSAHLQAATRDGPYFRPDLGHTPSTNARPAIGSPSRAAARVPRRGRQVRGAACARAGTGHAPRLAGVLQSVPRYRACHCSRVPTQVDLPGAGPIARPARAGSALARSGSARRRPSLKSRGDARTGESHGHGRRDARPVGLRGPPVHLCRQRDHHGDPGGAITASALVSRVAADPSARRTGTAPP